MKTALPLILALAALTAGCATDPTPEKKIIVNADQTEVVMPVGSHIRTRVLKGQKPDSASPVATASGEQLNDSLLTRDGSVPNVPVPKASP
jgi:hypothetical protein